VIGTMTWIEELARFGATRAHLPECRNPRAAPVVDCEWCEWAVLIPEVTTLLDIGNDARTLLRSEVADTVAGAVALTQLLDLFAGLRLDAIHVESARRLAGNIRDETGAALARLECRVRNAARAGGPLDDLLRLTGGTIAAVELQSSAAAEVVATFPDRLRTSLQDLAGMSTQVQLASLLPVVEHHLWRGMPDLATQPEWRRRTGPSERSRLGQLQITASGAEPRSLEALVVESLIDECTQHLLDLGPELAEAAPPVRYTRPHSELRHSAKARNILWRVARFDWHLTFIDTGLALCWGARSEDGAAVTDVPWIIHRAITALRRAGHHSALHHQMPTVNSYAGRCHRDGTEDPE